ncbi:MAG: hypothetical protein JNJ95_11160 [Dechloromonas sp.]|nr:hypothetical protein [Dechloromonas sp.]
MTTRKAPAKPRAPRKASAEAKPSTTPASKAAAKSGAKPAKASAKPRNSRGVQEKTVVKPRPTTPPATVAATPAARSRSASRSATSTVDRKNTPISEFTLANTRHDTRVSPNFLIYELTRSELADRRGIPNNFASDKELRAAIHLAREVLQPIRDKFGSFTPNSVFRGQPLERALKNKPASWLSTSQHSRGEACDIEIVGMSTLALAEWARDNLTFDQIICECYDPAKGPNSGWVHISLKAPGTGENRRQLLSYIADNGKMVYVPGLRATAMA